jgi:hypothetical protein
MESASGKTNRDFMNMVCDVQVGFHCRAMNDELLYFILEWIRGQHVKASPSGLCPKIYHLRLSKC